VELSLVCCVNRREVFEDCVIRSLERRGAIRRIEILCIDNCTNRWSVPQALNLGLDRAQAPVIVFCHQDVWMPEGWLDRSLSQMALIERTDPRWGVAGVMGVGFDGAFAGHVKDPHTNRPFGRLPRKVQSLDEVCLMIRRTSGLRFDENLGGYHFYGADLCLQARMKGMECYAVDAPVGHLSGGRCDESFCEMARRFCAKWHTVPLAPSVVETTCGVFPVGEGVKVFLLTQLLRLRRKLWRRLQRRGNKLTGERFRTRGYFVSTVSRDEKAIRDHIQRQEQEDRPLDQMNMFD